MNEEFDLDVVYGPRRSEKRAWTVAFAAVGLVILMGIVIVALLPLRSTEVFTVLVDRQTGEAEKVMQVQPTGIADDEAIKQSLLVSYITDRESFLTAGLQERLESVQRRSLEGARTSLQELWTKNEANVNYPPTVYGAGSEVSVKIKTISFLRSNVARVRFEKTLRRPRQAPIVRPFVATLEFTFDPSQERSLLRVWENPLGFKVKTYRVDAETLGE